MRGGALTPSEIRLIRSSNNKNQSNSVTTSTPQRQLNFGSPFATIQETTASSLSPNFRRRFLRSSTLPQDDQHNEEDLSDDEDEERESPASQKEQHPLRGHHPNSDNDDHHKPTVVGASSTASAIAAILEDAEQQLFRTSLNDDDIVAKVLSTQSLAAAKAIDQARERAVEFSNYLPPASPSSASNFKDGSNKKSKAEQSSRSGGGPPPTQQQQPQHEHRGSNDGTKQQQQQLPPSSLTSSSSSPSLQATRSFDASEAILQRRASIVASTAFQLQQRLNHWKFLLPTNCDEAARRELEITQTLRDFDALARKSVTETLMVRLQSRQWPFRYQNGIENATSLRLDRGGGGEAAVGATSNFCPTSSSSSSSSASTPTTMKLPSQCRPFFSEATWTSVQDGLRCVILCQPRLLDLWGGDLGEVVRAAKDEVKNRAHILHSCMSCRRTVQIPLCGVVSVLGIPVFVEAQLGLTVKSTVIGGGIFAEGFANLVTSVSSENPNNLSSSGDYSMNFGNTNSNNNNNSSSTFGGEFRPPLDSFATRGVACDEFRSTSLSLFIVRSISHEFGLAPHRLLKDPVLFLNNDCEVHLNPFDHFVYIRNVRRMFAPIVSGVMEEEERNWFALLDEEEEAKEKQKEKLRQLRDMEVVADRVLTSNKHNNGKNDTNINNNNISSSSDNKNNNDSGVLFSSTTVHPKQRIPVPSETVRDAAASAPPNSTSNATQTQSSLPTSSSPSATIAISQQLSKRTAEPLLHFRPEFWYATFRRHPATFVSSDAFRALTGGSIQFLQAQLQAGLIHDRNAALASSQLYTSCVANLANFLVSEIVKIQENNSNQEQFADRQNHSKSNTSTSRTWTTSSVPWTMMNWRSLPLNLVPRIFHAFGVNFSLAGFVLRRVERQLLLVVGEQRHHNNHSASSTRDQLRTAVADITRASPVCRAIRFEMAARCASEILSVTMREMLFNNNPIGTPESVATSRLENAAKKFLQMAMSDTLSDVAGEGDVHLWRDRIVPRMRAAFGYDPFCFPTPSAQASSSTSSPSRVTQHLLSKSAELFQPPTAASFSTTSALLSTTKQQQRTTTIRTTGPHSIARRYNDNHPQSSLPSSCRPLPSDFDFGHPSSDPVLAAMYIVGFPVSVTNRINVNPWGRADLNQTETLLPSHSATCPHPKSIKALMNSKVLSTSSSSSSATLSETQRFISHHHEAIATASEGNSSWFPNFVVGTTLSYPSSSSSSSASSATTQQPHNATSGDDAVVIARAQTSVNKVPATTSTVMVHHPLPTTTTTMSYRDEKLDYLFSTTLAAAEAKATAEANNNNNSNNGNNARATNCGVDNGKTLSFSTASSYFVDSRQDWRFAERLLQLCGIVLREPTLQERQEDALGRYSCSLVPVTCSSLLCQEPLLDKITTTSMASQNNNYNNSSTGSNIHMSEMLIRIRESMMEECFKPAIQRTVLVSVSSSSRNGIPVLPSLGTSASTSNSTSNIINNLSPPLPSSSSSPMQQQQPPVAPPADLCLLDLWFKSVEIARCIGDASKYRSVTKACVEVLQKEFVGPLCDAGVVPLLMSMSRVDADSGSFAQALEHGSVAASRAEASLQGTGFLVQAWENVMDCVRATENALHPRSGGSGNGASTSLLFLHQQHRQQQQQQRGGGNNNNNNTNNNGNPRFSSAISSSKDNDSSSSSSLTAITISSESIAKLRHDTAEKLRVAARSISNATTGATLSATEALEQLSVQIFDWEDDALIRGAILRSLPRFETFRHEVFAVVADLCGLRPEEMCPTASSAFMTQLDLKRMKESWNNACRAAVTLAVQQGALPSGKSTNIFAQLLSKIMSFVELMRYKMIFTTSADTMTTTNNNCNNGTRVNEHARSIDDEKMIIGKQIDQLRSVEIFKRFLLWIARLIQILVRSPSLQSSDMACALSVLSQTLLGLHTQIRCDIEFLHSLYRKASSMLARGGKDDDDDSDYDDDYDTPMMMTKTLGKVEYQTSAHQTAATATTTSDHQHNPGAGVGSRSQCSGSHHHHSNSNQHQTDAASSVGTDDTYAPPSVVETIRHRGIAWFFGDCNDNDGSNNNNKNNNNANVNNSSLVAGLLPSSQQQQPDLFLISNHDAFQTSLDKETILFFRKWASRLFKDVPGHQVAQSFTWDATLQRPLTELICSAHRFALYPEISLRIAREIIATSVMSCTTVDPIWAAQKRRASAKERHVVDRCRENAKSLDIKQMQHPLRLMRLGSEANAIPFCVLPLLLDVGASLLLCALVPPWREERSKQKLLQMRALFGSTTGFFGGGGFGGGRSTLTRTWSNGHHHGSSGNNTRLFLPQGIGQTASKMNLLRAQHARSTQQHLQEFIQSQIPTHTVWHPASVQVRARPAFYLSSAGGEYVVSFANNLSVRETLTSATNPTTSSSSRSSSSSPSQQPRPSMTTGSRSSTLDPEAACAETGKDPYSVLFPKTIDIALSGVDRFLTFCEEVIYLLHFTVASTGNNTFENNNNNNNNSKQTSSTNMLFPDRRTNMDGGELQAWFTELLERESGLKYSKMLFNQQHQHQQRQTEVSSSASIGVLPSRESLPSWFMPGTWSQSTVSREQLMKGLNEIVKSNHETPAPATNTRNKQKNNPDTNHNENNEIDFQETTTASFEQQQQQQQPPQRKVIPPPTARLDLAAHVGRIVSVVLCNVLMPLMAELRMLDELTKHGLSKEARRGAWCEVLNALLRIVDISETASASIPLEESVLLHVAAARRDFVLPSAHIMIGVGEINEKRNNINNPQQQQQQQQHQQEPTQPPPPPPPPLYLNGIPREHSIAYQGVLRQEHQQRKPSKTIRKGERGHASSSQHQEQQALCYDYCYPSYWQQILFEAERKRCAGATTSLSASHESGKAAKNSSSSSSSSSSLSPSPHLGTLISIESIFVACNNADSSAATNSPVIPEEAFSFRAGGRLPRFEECHFRLFAMICAAQVGHFELGAMPSGQASFEAKGEMIAKHLEARIKEEKEIAQAIYGEQKRIVSGFAIAAGNFNLDNKSGAAGATDRRGGASKITLATATLGKYGDSSPPAATTTPPTSAVAPTGTIRSISKQQKQRESDAVAAANALIHGAMTVSPHVVTLPFVHPPRSEDEYSGISGSPSASPASSPRPTIHVPPPTISVSWILPRNATPTRPTLAVLRVPPEGIGKNIVNSLKLKDALITVTSFEVRTIRGQTIVPFVVPSINHNNHGHVQSLLGEYVFGYFTDSRPDHSPVLISDSFRVTQAPPPRK